MTTETAVAKREPQAAIVPLNAIDVQDVASSAAAFDAWLQSATDGVVTLDRIKNYAGFLPVVGNIMALVDALSDIVTLSDAKQRDLLTWASLGINLIGVLPLPPSMAAARMTLRPTLFLVRQEMRASGKLLLSTSVIEVLVGHLNASIIGTLDDFVEQAKGKLPGILADAGKLGEEIINEIATGIETTALGRFDAKGDLEEASARASVGRGQLLNDPLATADNFLAAANSALKAAGKGLANSVAQNLVSTKLQTQITTETGKLRAMGPELRTQLSKLDDKNVQNSIGWLLQILSSAVILWRKRNAHGQNAAVHTEKTGKATHTAAEGELGANNKQAPAKSAPNPEKGPCKCATEFSINFALGSESLSHTDFSLPGPFPIEWTRTYNSRLDTYDQSELGARWISEFTTRFDCVDDGLTFYSADGRDHSYPLPKVGLFH
ncbi:DUF6531 domain-containing protein, partial [Pseudomonas sp. SDT291_1_S447]